MNLMHAINFERSVTEQRCAAVRRLVAATAVRCMEAGAGDLAVWCFKTASNINSEANVKRGPATVIPFTKEKSTDA